MRAHKRIRFIFESSANIGRKKISPELRRNIRLNPETSADKIKNKGKISTIDKRIENAQKKKLCWRIFAIRHAISLNPHVRRTFFSLFACQKLSTVKWREERTLSDISFFTCSIRFSPPAKSTSHFLDESNHSPHRTNLLQLMIKRNMEINGATDYVALAYLSLVGTKMEQAWL